MGNKTQNRIIISRTDSIGDVMLTLPVAGILKSEFPDCEILFLGSSYTKDIVERSVCVDKFINYSELEKLSKEEQINQFRALNADTIIHIFPRKEIAKLAKNAGIKNRIGTSHRSYHWFTCNQLVSFSRKHSDLHESQLNTKLLKPLISKELNFSLTELSQLAGFTNITPLDAKFKEKFDSQRLNIILHPKSKGSAREWGLDHFSELINLLPESKFNIFITGTQKEGEEIENVFSKSVKRNVQSLCGAMSLSELVSFINEADTLIACSTGPLHIASIEGIHTIGLYPPIKPMDPGRWKPIGINSKVFVINKSCNDCRKSNNCKCIRDIQPKEIADYCNILFEEKQVRRYGNNI